MLSRRVEQWFASTVKIRPYDVHHSGGIVSFTFDDFPRSALRIGGDILQSHGAAGTYYASAGLADKTIDDIELFRWRDLNDLIDAGHELGCHTHSHINCQNSNVREIESDCNDNAAALAEVLGEGSLRNFAFPFGSVGLAAKRFVSRNFATGRGIRPGINSGISDLSQLNAYALYDRLITQDRIESLIGQSNSKNGWLIFYTHDISKSPSKYGCSPDILEFAVRSARNQGSSILSMAEALAVLREGR